jgi:hypothetical protein
MFVSSPQLYSSNEADDCTGNGSDVFGSDICTCKPYLTYAIEECIRGAQNGEKFIYTPAYITHCVYSLSGGVGVVVYFRKEGRALGEVTKYVFYPIVPTVLTKSPDTSSITSVNEAVTPLTSTSSQLNSSLA